jgi:hypothetical protein
MWAHRGPARDASCVRAITDRLRARRRPRGVAPNGQDFTAAGGPRGVRSAGRSESYADGRTGPTAEGEKNRDFDAPGACRSPGHFLSSTNPRYNIGSSCANTKFEIYTSRSNFTQNPATGINRRWRNMPFHSDLRRPMLLSFLFRPESRPAYGIARPFGKSCGICTEIGRRRDQFRLMSRRNRLSRKHLMPRKPAIGGRTRQHVDRVCFLYPINSQYVALTTRRIRAVAP